MMPPPTTSRVFCFGAFQIDLKAGEVYKRGVRVKLQQQPFQVLAMLLEHLGDVVTRQELRHRIWPNDTFGDFDQGLNKAIKKIREALGDSPQAPRFVETLPKRGYRFIAPAKTYDQAPRPYSSIAQGNLLPQAWLGPRPALEAYSFLRRGFGHVASALIAYSLRFLRFQRPIPPQTPEPSDE